MAKEKPSIAAIFEWAWQNGLEVSLYCKNYEMPFATSYRREPIKWDGPNKAVMHMPVLRFSHRANDRSQEIMGTNWPNLMEALKYEHTRIFAQLACKPMEIDNG